MTQPAARGLWFVWLAPGSLALCVALAGQFLPALAYLAFFGGLPSLAWLVWLLVMILWRAWKRRPLLATVAGVLPAAAALLATGNVVLGVPYWVRTRAAPAMEALHRYRAEHGHYPQVDSTLVDEFPKELQPTLRRAGCLLYRPRGSAFDLTCNGVAFTKCTFEAASGRWRSWD